MTARAWLQRLAPVVVSVAALAALLANVDVAALIDALSWRVVFVFGPALLLYGALTLLIDALSLRMLVGPSPSGLDLATAARIKCASYLLGIIHYALGAAALSVLLRRRAAIGLGAAAGVVLLISASDLLAVLVLGAAGTLASRAESLSGTLLLLVPIAALGFFGGLALLRMPASLGPLERIRSLAVFEALRTTPSSRLAALIVLRAVFVLSFAAVSGAAFLAFGLSPAPGLLVAGMLAIAVVAALPIAVSGLGTGQVAFLFLFRDVADPATLLALSLVLSFGMIALRVGLGLVFAREFTREALVQARRERADDVAFTGERLHAGSELFALDIVRHRVAYEEARRRAGPGWLLDLGCGSGYGAAALAGERERVVGVDRVPPDADHRGGPGHFVRADLEALPFADGRFDTVTNFQVIEHFEDPEPLIRAIARLLRPDGLALITTPNRLMSDGVNPYHVHEYVADELAERLAERFEQVEMHGVGASEAVHRYFAGRAQRVRRIMRLDPLRLRERLPRAFVGWLFARLAVLVRSLARRSGDLPMVDLEDFPVGPADDRCLDLLAVCRKPREKDRSSR